MRFLALTFLALALLTASVRADNATLFGTGIGAAMGGLLGSQFGHGAGQVAATGTGIILGGLVGNEVGSSIDASNYPAYPSSYVPDSYGNPITFNAYAPNYVAPPALPPTYVNPNAGTYCRPYSQETRIAGRIEENYGTACLQPDGTWRAVQ